MAKKPTIKQTIAYTKALENGGNISKAMLEAGYTKSMSENPQKLTDSLGWKELMNKYWSDKLIAKTIKNNMKATKKEVIAGKVEIVQDRASQLKAVEIALKAKGRYIESATQVNLDGLKIEIAEPVWTEDNE